MLLGFKLCIQAAACCAIVEISFGLLLSAHESAFSVHLVVIDCILMYPGLLVPFDGVL